MSMELNIIDQNVFLRSQVKILADFFTRISHYDVNRKLTFVKWKYSNGDVIEEDDIVFNIMEKAFDRKGKKFDNVVVRTTFKNEYGVKYVRVYTMNNNNGAITTKWYGFSKSYKGDLYEIKFMIKELDKAFSELSSNKKKFTIN